MAPVILESSFWYRSNLPRAVSFVPLSGKRGLGSSNSSAPWPVASVRACLAFFRIAHLCHYAGGRFSNQRLFLPLMRLALDLVEFYRWLIEP